MNIALFPSAFHPHFGGVEELSRQLGLELKRQGHEVIVLTNRWPRDLSSEEEIDGLRVYRLPFRFPIEGSLKSRLTYLATREVVSRRVASILRRHAIEVMNVQCVSSNVLYALEARRRLSIPLVVTLQGELTMDATRLYQRSAAARALLLRALEEAEQVTGCSQKTLSDAEAFFDLKLGDRGRRIFNAARADDFVAARPFSHPRPYLFAVGRCVPQKGFDILLRAYAASDVSGMDLIIAGDGEELPMLRQLASELGLEKRVMFFGKADRAAVASLFAGCEFFVLPSRADEGLPVVCAEAMAAGRAIVATRSGGVPEAILDGATGLIVEREQIEPLAAAIGRLAGDASLRARFAEEGRQRAVAFSWSAVSQCYLDSYRGAIASRRTVDCGSSDSSDMAQR